MDIREQIQTTFKNYTDKYDISDPKIRLKVEHTYRVAELSCRIATSISSKYALSEDDITLAWIIGMLHDVGRFEQVRRYGTFIDSQSVDHAQFGADLLFGPDKEAELDMILPEVDLIEKAIRNHNKFRIAEDLSEREILFANIIRDADKVDILKVNVDFSDNDIYGISEEEVLNADISDDVLEAVIEGSAVNRALVKTPMDTIVAHASMMQELVFDLSRQIVKEQGYLVKLLDKDVKKSETIKKLELVKNQMKVAGLM